MKTMTQQQRPALAASANRLRYTPAPPARTPVVFRPLPAAPQPQTAKAEPSTAPTVAQVRSEERARASRLLAASVDSPLLTHYQRLAAMPSAGSGERPATWGMKARAIILMALGLGFGLGIAISGAQVIARMMGQ